MEKDYRKVVELLGGEIIKINPENTATLNPLAVSINDENEIEKPSN